MKLKKILKCIAIVLLCVVLLIGAAVGAVCLRLNSAVSNVTRVDEDGFLYTMDYTASYDNALTKFPITYIKSIGCSAFVTRNEDGDVITARNYDLPHKDDTGNATGLNVIFRLNPKNGYASINTADAAWLTMIGIPYTAGALDEGGASPIFLAFLPYLCMDGMNEKGLSVSILALDLKDGETAVAQDAEGKESVTITELLRLMLDGCADVDEAIAMAQDYNMTNILGGDYHLFVTDETGRSVVLEWRWNTLYITETDAVTNFYVGFDDGEDLYYGDTLKEAFVKNEDTLRSYHFGYGHGFGRFNTVIAALNEHIVNTETFETEMTDEEAMAVLEAVSQTYDGTSISSQTQYSVIYNNSERTVKICAMCDYEAVYEFSLAE